jgi:hypothetical protein
MPTNGGKSTIIEMSDIDCATNEQRLSIKAEAERVLEDPVFQRSAVLSRLLTYLVANTLEGESVKAFEVAAEGLGRTDLRTDPDTYARVAVARLRKALEAYYAAGHHQAELKVDLGTYAVRLVPVSPQDLTAEEALAVDLQPQNDRGSRAKHSNRKLKLFAIAGLLVATVSLVIFLPRESENAWQHPNFPNVAVSLGSDKVTDAGRICQQRMMFALSGYRGIRLQANGGPLPDFVVQMESVASDSEQSSMITLVHRSTNRIVWTFPSIGSGPCPSEDETHEIAFALARPGGVIEGFARRQGVNPDTPYGCWLHFTKNVSSYNSIGDRALEECARDWYASVPDHAIAGMLRGWTLTDKAAFAITPGGKSAGLERALTVLQETSSLNSEAAILDIASMRAHSFAGNRSLVIQHANDAIAKARGNRLIVGMSASGMALWNEPRGYETLKQIANTQTNRPPWEHVGLFVSAMMREDLEIAGQEMAQLEKFDRSQPLVLLLKAAYLQRTGQGRAAQQALARLDDDPRILIAGHARLINRLPMAPEVKRKLNEWLSASKR